MTEPTAHVKEFQRVSNKFTKLLDGVGPLRVDGVPGHDTHTRALTDEYYLGYGKDRRGVITDKLIHRLAHPHSLRWSSPRMLVTAARRRRRQRAHAAHSARGVRVIDGVKVADWIAEWVIKARARGWAGHVTSGYRDPAYSESLCEVMCGAPRCPGKCAGRSSNHSGVKYPSGAVDVTDYERFGQIMKQLNSPLFNAIGASDPVHFSFSGR